MTNFNLLLNSIKSIHQQLQDSAAKAVNKLLTLRNWLIGYYIVEYEQNGEDRAQYGGKLLENILLNLPNLGFSKTNLKLFRQFYLIYPQISQSVTDLLKTRIGQSLADQLLVIEHHSLAIGQSPIAQSVPSDLMVPPDKLVSLQKARRAGMIIANEQPKPPTTPKG